MSAGLLATAGISAAVLAGQGTALSVRDRQWQQDVAYLSRELPLVHVDGLTQVGRPPWTAAAARLEAQVPRLSDGQVIVGMARLVALLHDDETSLVLPPSAVYPVNLQWIGGGLYFIALPASDRAMLGARLVAVDRHPIAHLLARLRTVIDYQDAGVARAQEIGWDQIGPQMPGYLNDADLLYWLGLTRSSSSARFSLRAAGRPRTLRLDAIGPGGQPLPHIVSLPTPLYQQHLDLPYWMETLRSRNAVYLKYNRCLSGQGFQRLALRALRLLRDHPVYRLIIDLRDNGGGDSRPFQALIDGIVDDSRINQPGRIFGLVNGLTASSASLDANALNHQTSGVLIGQTVADPIDKFGNDNNSLRLPHYGIVIQYTTKVVNPRQARYGIPNITIAPTLRDWLTGADPVLAAALAYDRSAG